ncbi:MAG: N-acetyltransferase [Variovorax sp.]|nr:MAG: N-acetyltransferase [Variovorax sp.]
MASTEHVARQVEALNALGDVDLATLGQLVADSGWNQTADDWALFATQGSIYVVRDADRRIVASGAVLPMGAKAAWISMVLVTPGARGQGVGRQVFAHCLEVVRQSGRTAMLDATPAGEALYRQFDFSPLWRLTRWQRAAQPATSPALHRESIDLDALAALDADALGFARRAVLEDLADREGSRLLRRANGFAIVRAGRIAHQIGPLLATSEAAAAALLGDAAARLAGPVFVDVPDDRPALREWLAGAGFTTQRSFARMAAGADAPEGQRSFIHAIAGPEFG